MNRWRSFYVKRKKWETNEWRSIAEIILNQLGLDPTLNKKMERKEGRKKDDADLNEVIWIPISSNHSNFKMRRNKWKKIYCRKRKRSSPIPNTMETETTGRNEWKVVFFQNYNSLIAPAHSHKTTQQPSQDDVQSKSKRGETEEKEIRTRNKAYYKIHFHVEKKVMLKIWCLCEPTKNGEQRRMRKEDWTRKNGKW